MKRKHQGQDSLCKEKCLNLNANVYLFACKLDISVPIRDSGDVHEDDSVAQHTDGYCQQRCSKPSLWCLVSCCCCGGQGCCRVPVCPSCTAGVDGENEPNVTACPGPGKRAKPFINTVRSGDPSQWGAGAFASRAVLWPPWWADLAHPAHT